MYGYCTPRKPELSRLRVMTTESEVCALQRAYALSRDEVLQAMSRAGPLRGPVESELARIAGQKHR